MQRCSRSRSTRLSALAVAVFLVTANAITEEVALKYDAEGPRALRASVQQAKYDGDLDFFFVHIPKTGGSSVEEMFKHIGINVGKYMSVRESGPRMSGPRMTVPASFAANNTIQSRRECSIWHVPPKHAEVSFENRVTFTMVRDPLTRLLSQFQYQMRMTRGRDKFGEVYETDPVAAFDAWVAHLFEVGVESTVSDCHLLPQSMYLNDAEGNAIDHVLRFEHYTEDLQSFARNYSLPAEPFSPGKQSHTRQYEHHIDPADVKASTVVMVRWLYRVDYEFFEDYDFNAPLSARAG
mmetsp:Transcript_42406/g.132958  ORF Transcript_42406/g.132958 Transcript_42406/m.132958 type:complete len:294 (+) Transcript_42406:296-1177(+)